jgi:hypothetical protein
VEADLQAGLGLSACRAPLYGAPVNGPGIWVTLAGRKGPPYVGIDDDGTICSVALPVAPPSTVAAIVTGPTYPVVPTLNVAVDTELSAGVMRLNDPIVAPVLVVAE